MFVHSNEKKKLLIFMFMFICWLLKKKGGGGVSGTWAWQTRVPYYKELKPSILEYHRRKEKKKSITLKFCIYKELKLSMLEYCVTWNSSLPSLSSMWHFFKKTSAQIFFMKLECLKLDLHSKLEFHELEFQKVV